MEFFEFEAALLRLRQSLGVRHEKDVARALGLTCEALSMRKNRGSFPERNLRELAERLPALRLDVDFILTGRGK